MMMITIIFTILIGNENTLQTKAEKLVAFDASKTYNGIFKKEKKQLKLQNVNKQKIAKRVKSLQSLQ